MKTLTCMVAEDLLQLLVIHTDLRPTSVVVMNPHMEIVMVVIGTVVLCHLWVVLLMTDVHLRRPTTHQLVQDLTTAEGLLHRALWVTHSKFVPQ